MTVRAAGIVVAEALGAVLVVAVAVGAVLLGFFDAEHGPWLAPALAAILVVPAAFTGWLCPPRVLEPWRGRLAPPTMAAVTASTSTAVFIWGGLLAATVAIDVTDGALDPASWSLESFGLWSLSVGIPTSTAVVASLRIAAPLGVAWVWLTGRLIGRDVARAEH
jgi:hypothetical protein